MGSICWRAWLFHNENMSALNICLQCWELNGELEWILHSAASEIRPFVLNEKPSAVKLRSDLDLEKPGGGQDQAREGKAVCDGSEKQYQAKFILIYAHL